MQDISLMIAIGSLIAFILFDIVLVVLILKKYKHLFVAKFLTGGKPIVKVYKCRERKDKVTNAIYWHPLGRGLKKFVKPDEHIIIPNQKKKGGWYAEGYVDKEGVVIQTLYDVYDGKETPKSLTAFTEEHRQILINQEIKANKREKKTWWDKFGTTAMALGFIIIMAILIFSFWEDIWQPLNSRLDTMEAHESQVYTYWLNITETMERTAKILEQGKGQIQYME